MIDTQIKLFYLTREFFKKGLDTAFLPNHRLQSASGHPGFPQDCQHCQKCSPALLHSDKNLKDCNKLTSSGLQYYQ